MIARSARRDKQAAEEKAVAADNALLEERERVSNDIALVSLFPYQVQQQLRHHF